MVASSYNQSLNLIHCLFPPICKDLILLSTFLCLWLRTVLLNDNSLNRISCKGSKKSVVPIISTCGVLPSETLPSPSK